MNPLFNNDNNDSDGGDNYRGYLLAAHPRRREAVYRHGVMLVVDHGNGGSVGFQINKMITEELSLQTVMLNMGIDSDVDAPVFFGGDEKPNRISVVHSLDWSSENTCAVTDYIGVSRDVSVLASLADGTGPEYFRVIAGHAKWKPGHLESEISGSGPWSTDLNWAITPASHDLVFLHTGLSLWHQVIRESTRLTVSEWFN